MPSFDAQAISTLHAPAPDLAMHGIPATRLLYRTISEKSDPMNINLALTPLVSLIAGILILIMPRLLNYIVAFYLIAIGLIGIFGASNFNFR